MLLTLQRYGSKSKITVILDEASLKTAWSQYCRSTRADGGKALLSIKHRESVIKLWNDDWTITAIARDVGVSRTTVYRILKKGRDV